MNDEQFDDLNYKNRIEETGFTNQVLGNEVKLEIKEEFDDESRMFKQDVKQKDEMADVKIENEDFDYENQAEETNFLVDLQNNGFKQEIEDNEMEVEEISADKSLLVHKSSEDSQKINFHCDICNKSFDYVGKFRRHIQNFNQKQLVECTQCTKFIMSRHNLEKHKQEHTGSFTCNLCETDFSGIRDFIIHNLTIHPEEPILPKKNLFKEPEIDFDLSKNDKKKAKEARKRLNRMRFICILCNELFENSTEFKKHKKSFNRPIKLNCAQCGELMKTKHGLVNHLLTHTEKLNCCICKIEFEDMKSFTGHCRKKHRQSQISFHCKDCKRTFISHKNLAMHRLTHLEMDDKAKLLAKKKDIWSPREEERKMCEICNISFEKTIGHRLHMQIYNEKMIWYCPQCAEVCTSKHDCVHHLSTHIGDYTCPICKKDFIIENDFLIHKNEEHSLEPNLQCKKCNQEFPNAVMFIKHALDEHMDGYEVFEKVLQYEDILKDNRRELWKSKKGNIGYMCHLCGKTYSDNNFESHKEIDLGKIWYLCRKCDQTFGDWKSCRSHQLTEHVE